MPRKKKPPRHKYYDPKRTARFVKDGRHRDCIGGLWDEMGRRQFEFVHARGLTPGMYMLDVGCGCLRGGVHFVDFLAPGHYYGIDISAELLEAGYQKELGPLGLQSKLPRENLRCEADFRADRFGAVFDMALAQSVFTHLPLNHLKLCLTRLAPVVRPGGIFYATFFLADDEHEWAEPIVHSPGKITTYPTADPYHYREADLVFCTVELPWRFRLDGDWGHPRNQSMVAFTRSEQAGS